MLSMLDTYNDFLESDLTGEALIRLGFQHMEQLFFWNKIKRDFIEMNYFDILIGNQDRHPYNWMILFISSDNQSFSTIYDNGASLGFRFDDQQLSDYINDKNKLEKYMRKSTVKGGLFEKKRVKAFDMANYLYKYYPNESQQIIKKIKNYDLERFNQKVDKNVILTNTQKRWLKLIISFRRKNLLQWLGEEE